jgi:hypothetical protein
MIRSNTPSFLRRSAFLIRCRQAQDRTGQDRGASFVSSQTHASFVVGPPRFASLLPVAGSDSVQPCSMSMSMSMSSMSCK